MYCQGNSSLNTIHKTYIYSLYVVFSYSSKIAIDSFGLECDCAAVSCQIYVTNGMTGARKLDTKKNALSNQRRLLRKSASFRLSIALLTGAAFLAAPHTPDILLHGVAGSSFGQARSLPSDYPRVKFTDVTQEAGIRFEHFHGVRSTQLPEDMGSGAAWGDYDNDGYPDLYVVDVAGPLTASAEELAHSPGGNRLYHNNGDGTFTDVTKKAGIGFKGIGMAAAWADYDNDGRLDLVVTSYDRIILYHNNGDGTFTDVTAKAGLDKYRGFWTGAAWGDYDRDGNVDLFICGYVKYQYHQEDLKKTSLQYSAVVPFTLNPAAYPPERKLLLHNNGEGTFTDVAAQAEVDDPTGRSLSAAWYDFDGDGWPDLYVANDLWGSKLYLNLHNGKFKDVTRDIGLSDFRGQMGIAIGDCDNDGKPDLFVVNGSTFQDDRNPTHLVPMKNHLFWQHGPSQRFYEVGELSGATFQEAHVGRGAAFADYDNDGDMDVFIVNQEGRPTLLRNDGGNKKNWIKVRVKCTKSNRTGFGTKVEIEAGGQKQIQEIGGQTSYLSQNFQEAHFGLNLEKEVAHLTITFPSGIVREREHIPANQIVTVVE